MDNGKINMEQETDEKIMMIIKHAEKRCLVANSMKTQGYYY